MNSESDQLEQCACPLCGADSPQSGQYAQPPYRVVCCGNCSAWYLSPRLREEHLLRMYESADYFQSEESGYASYAEQEATLRATFRKFLRSLASQGVTGGALLDVGCAYGYLLDEARPYFQFRAGAECSAEAARIARGFADEIYVGGAEAIPHDRRFDVIVAAHVVEHVYDPRQFVAALVHCLRPGGRLILAAPDMGSFWRRWMGNRWPSFKYPEHVVYYDKKSLARLLDQAGLADVAPVPYPHAFPLGEVLRKLRLPGAGRLNALKVWFPATTVALSGRRAA